MVAAQFRVEPAAVSLAAIRLSSLAGDGVWSGVGEPLTDAAGTAAGSDLSAQAAGLAAEVGSLVERLTGVLATMSEAAGASAANYLAADEHAAAAFLRTASCLPGPAAIPPRSVGAGGADWWGAPAVGGLPRWTGTAGR